MDDITRHVLKQIAWPAIIGAVALLLLLVALSLTGCAPNPVGPDITGLDGPPVLRLGFVETTVTMDTTAKAFCWVQQNARYKNTALLNPQPGEDEARLQAREFYENNGGECRGFASWLVYCARIHGRRTGALYLGGNSPHLIGWALEPSGKVSYNSNEAWFLESGTPDEIFAFFLSYRAAGIPISFLDDHYQDLKTDEAALQYMRGN